MMSPCASAATGSGKTLCITTLAQAVTAKGKRMMTVTHVKELIGQLEATAIAQGLVPGVYAAGLNRRDKSQNYLICQIQSVYKRAFDFPIPDVLCIDEAHLLNSDDEGMYRTFIGHLRVANPKMRLVGLSATPFRMGSGLIYGPDRMFEACVARVGMKELITDGYLTPIIGKNGDRNFSAADLHMRGGEFIAAEIEAMMADEAKVSLATKEILHQCVGRNQILHFTTGNKHSVMLMDELRKSGETAEMVNGEMAAGERERMLTGFRTRQFRHLVNCALLTTGYDDTGIDAICNLRPTRSPGLLLQMAGRGLRLDPRKTNTLFLDFGGSLEYFGPLDLIEEKITARKSVEIGGEAPMKTCPMCAAVVFAGRVKCDCGYVWERKLNHETTASGAAVLSGVQEKQVSRTMYTVHSPRDIGKKPMLKVVHYTADRESVSEYLTVSPEDSATWARKQLEGWLASVPRKDLPGWSLTMEAGVMKGVRQGQEAVVITSAVEMLPFCQCLVGPKTIKVMPSTNNPRYSSVVGRSF
jgi:DNA repair protein RadD